MQIDPVKPMLNQPESKRLKLKCDKLLSTIGFNFNLRRHTKGAENAALRERNGVLESEAGAYTRPVFSST